MLKIKYLWIVVELAIFLQKYLFCVQSSEPSGMFSLRNKKNIIFYLFLIPPLIWSSETVGRKAQVFGTSLNNYY